MLMRVSTHVDACRLPTASLTPFKHSVQVMGEATFSVYTLPRKISRYLLIVGDGSLNPIRASRVGQSTIGTQHIWVGTISTIKGFSI